MPGYGFKDGIMVKFVFGKIAISKCVSVLNDDMILKKVTAIA